nr:hypothetical protein [uncultured Methanobacterium sp.]
MEVAEKEDGDSFNGDDSSSFIENYSSIDNCMELTANTEKLNLNVENSYKDHTTFNKSLLPCKERNYSGYNHYSGFNHCSGFNQDSRFNYFRFNYYSEFNLITNLTVSKVPHDSDKQNKASSVIGYRTRGVIGWQQKI